MSNPALGRSAMSACTDREARTDATVMCWLELATESAEELPPICRLPLSQYHRAGASSIAGCRTLESALDAVEHYARRDMISYKRC